MKILITGGAGYIGSHFVKYAVGKNQEIIVFDNLSRGHREAVTAKTGFEQVDLIDFAGLKKKIASVKPDAIVHFAAFAYVGESVENPAMYYNNNVVGSINLIRAALESGVKKFIFSSTCSLYGNPLIVPITEQESVKPINPYAQTKLIIENTLKDFDNAYGLKFIALRYFNAAGADPDGLIGESHDPEPHLIPIVLQAALGKRGSVSIFGDDYIHVNDLADAHYRALEYLNAGNNSEIINLGTGNGYSVKEIISAAEKVTGRKIKTVISARREGDPATLVADNTKAKKVLGWNPQYNLEDIIKTAWNWHQNPKY